MSIVILPKSLPSPEKFYLLVERYKNFRLSSLHLSPEAFGSTYAAEIAFPFETWESRVSNPLATNLIVVATESSPHRLEGPDIDRIIEKDWMASLTLAGPFNKEDAPKKLESMYIRPGIVTKGDSKWCFALSAMYVLPTARGGGLGVKLVEYAKTVASELVGGEKVRILLVVDFENEGARKTYEKCGFEVIERHWFDDYRPGRGERTEAAVMNIDMN